MTHGTRKRIHLKRNLNRTHACHLSFRNLCETIWRMVFITPEVIFIDLTVRFSNSRLKRSVENYRGRRSSPPYESYRREAVVKKERIETCKKDGESCSIKWKFMTSVVVVDLKWDHCSVFDKCSLLKEFSSLLFFSF